MSRAILKMALARTLHRPPSDSELSEYLAALAALAGGHRVYIAHRLLNPDELTAEVVRLSRAGYSVRRIAKAAGCSKSHVANILRTVHNSALSVDSNTD